MAFYIIEDHPLMRDALALLLRRVRPGATLVTLDLVSALHTAVEQNGEPELIVLDLKLPDSSGVHGVRYVRGHFPKALIVVFTAMPALEMEEACVDAGADAYLEKSASMNDIISVFEALLQDPSSSGEAAALKPNAEPVQLSKRQAQLVEMMDHGLSNREIAAKLGISEHTVKVHLWRLFRRIGVKSRTQAVHYARTNGLLKL